MVGEVPHWWETLQAARHLGVSPWELEAAPYLWKVRALEAIRTEQEMRG